VVFCEHKFLYQGLRADELDTSATPAPIGNAVVRRRGADCTVVAWSAMLHEAIAAAEALEREQAISVEVVDLRCLHPLDINGVLASVARTGRLVVASEDFPHGGIAAEVCAAVSQQGFTLLDAAPQRVSARPTPIPYHPQLWAAHRPAAADIARAVLHTVRF
ncbi:MAG: transketolase C-terminal domain-containing protein, partial [Planctomycetota bacterium]|jgi:pyruvate dehydrogenase E1 component beta subunit/2-oxoisovalerate dehydrogenase E1 component beta subunit